jgi:Na+/H+-dicarboxylate symporter
MVIIFLAQAFNIDPSAMQIFNAILVLLITSKDAAGMTGTRKYRYASLVFFIITK